MQVRFGTQFSIKLPPGKMAPARDRLEPALAGLQPVSRTEDFDENIFRFTTATPANDPKQASAELCALRLAFWRIAQDLYPGQSNSSGISSTVDELTYLYQRAKGTPKTPIAITFASPDTESSHRWVTMTPTTAT